jgi:hypothetical protein
MVPARWIVQGWSGKTTLRPVVGVRSMLAKRFVRWLCVVVMLATACSAGVAVPAVQDGDIMFQTSLSSQSVAIQRATHSKYSLPGSLAVKIRATGGDLLDEGSSLQLARHGCLRV